MGPYFVEGIDRILEKQANGFNKEGWKNVVTASWYD